MAERERRGSPFPFDVAKKEQAARLRSNFSLKKKDAGEIKGDK